MSLQPAFKQAFLENGSAAGAYAALLQDVFAFAPTRRPDADPAWVPLAYFEPTGRCVAGVEVAVLRLVADGEACTAAALRLAGVAAAHRGRGLFRDLMTRALAWCAVQSDGPVLLYAEEPTLYTRFGFQPLAQHAFVGAAPSPVPTEAAAIVELARAAALIDRLSPHRAPVSNSCALLGARDLLLERLRDDRDLRVAHSAELDALIVHEVADDELVLVDVVAAEMPTLARIVGALRSSCRRVRTLFPPDRLAWQGVPEPDDAGLMARGPVPAAMTRPFMLPPTTSF